MRTLPVFASGGSRLTGTGPAVLIGRASLAKLTPELGTALGEVRAASTHNRIPEREAYAYAYHQLYTPEPQRARELATLRQALIDRGVDVGTLLTPQGLAFYREAVLDARQRQKGDDLAGNQLARTGKEVFDSRRFLNCIDYAKAVAHRVHRNHPDADLRFFVTMDFAGYRTMCPRTSEPGIEPRPVVHTMIAYKKNGSWWAVSPEMDVTKPELEIFRLGPNLPSRLGPHFRIVDAPFVRGKDLVYAGTYDMRHPLVAEAMDPQTLKNIAASGLLSTAKADFVCR